MENASKALIMAASVIIGVLIISLATYLFTHFGNEANKVYERMEDHKLTEYNAQYTVYANRNDITIYEIITLANKANQNNKDYKDYTDFEELYKVEVKLTGISGISPQLQDSNVAEQQNLIKTYSEVDNNGNIRQLFECKEIKYHNNGKVSSIAFTKN